MKLNINERAIGIQNRFFQVLELEIQNGTCAGLQTFCNKYNLNRIKYSAIKNAQDIEKCRYKCIDIDALACLCIEFNISAEWLLLGVGEMKKKK